MAGAAAVLAALCCLLAALLPAAAAAGDTAEVAAPKVDLAELDRYLARKLDLVANLTAATPKVALGGQVGEAIHVLYFGDHNADETSAFQSSLSLLALLLRYSARRCTVGFVDTAAPAGETLRRQLGVANRHAIIVVVFFVAGVVASDDRRPRFAEFHGFRNVQLLLDFIERLVARLQSPGPRRLAAPRDKAAIDRTQEAAVLLVSAPEDEAAWAGDLETAAAQLPTYVGVGRRLAAAFGVRGGSACCCSLLYRGPTDAAFSATRLCPGDDDNLLSALRRLRAGSVLPLGPHNLYLPAAQAGGDSGSGSGSPLLVLLADPDRQAAVAAAAVTLMKRLLRQVQRRPQLASLNPWRRPAVGEPEIDWAGILGGGSGGGGGGLSLDRGPCFLLTTDRRLGGGGRPDGVFYLDGWGRLATDPDELEAAFAELNRWLDDHGRPELGAVGAGRTEL